MNCTACDACIAEAVANATNSNGDNGGADAGLSEADATALLIGKSVIIPLIFLITVAGSAVVWCIRRLRHAIEWLGTQHALMRAPPHTRAAAAHLRARASAVRLSLCVCAQVWLPRWPPV
jgi:hypothetical protein